MPKTKTEWIAGFSAIVSVLAIALGVAFAAGSRSSDLEAVKSRVAAVEVRTDSTLDAINRKLDLLHAEVAAIAAEQRVLHKNQMNGGK